MPAKYGVILKGNPVLYVPEIHWNYTHTNVMVMERIYGVPVGDIKRLADLGINFKRLGELGVEVFFTKVFPPQLLSCRYASNISLMLPIPMNRNT